MLAKTKEVYQYVEIGDIDIKTGTNILRFAHIFFGKKDLDFIC